MLESLVLKNFTVFPDAHFKFGKHLNVFVGENGAGKTHVLKVAYCVLAVSARGAKESSNGNPTKAYLQKALADKLRGVFRPDEIGRLVRRQPGRGRAEVKCGFDLVGQELAFSLNSTSKTEVALEELPMTWSQFMPVYLPTRELLTIAPGFVSLYDSAYLPFEETWRDTALLLQGFLVKGPRESTIRDLLKLLEGAMGGRVETDAAGRFYLRTPSGNIEMHLVAEGLRKLAMLARLIATGSLVGEFVDIRQTSIFGHPTLFWDEPEANLNPRTIKAIARTILQLCQRGTQVFIATHSLFLLRELYILQQNEFAALDSRCFGLHRGEDGAVTVEQGETMDDIGDIAALDEELMQSQRYLETEEELAQKA